MISQQEWKRRLARHRRFWQALTPGEGAYIAVTAPATGQARRTATGSNLEQIRTDEELDEQALHRLWFNIDHRLEEVELSLNQTFFGGDALPVASIDFGPGLLPALLGRPYKLAAETIWFDIEALKDVQDVEALSLQRDSEFYGIYLDSVKRLLAASEGRFLLPEADLGTAIDTLAAVYDRTDLLTDIALDPAKVDRLLLKAAGWRREALDEYNELLGKAQSHFLVYAPIANENNYRMHGAELGAMISPRSFEEIIVPALNRETLPDESVIYLMDGDSYARYLPQVLKLDRLHAIVWGPNTRVGEDGRFYKDWNQPASIELCRAIQEQGIKLILLGIPAFQVGPLFEKISPDGVFLRVSSDSREEAERLLDTWYEG